MKVSVNWLKDYVNIPISLKELSDRLTLAGLEVEKIFKVGKDTVFQIEITPNRPDLLSVIGIAREIAALLDEKLKIPYIELKSSKNKKLDLNVEIKDLEKCPFYSARIIEDVNIKNSPGGIFEKIKAVGIREVNNIVDVTNFCLFELGQPLHAFDYDKIKGKKIIIRNAKKGEEILTIDNQKRILDSCDLIIADKEKPIAIAGIIGGKNTEVTSDTKNIVIESAFFQPASIRKTAKRLGITTESSYRFERGVSFNLVKFTSKRATSIISKLNKNSKIGAYIEQNYLDDNFIITNKIKLKLDKLKQYLDIEIDSRTVLKIFKSLGIKCMYKKNILETEIPEFRKDLERDVDLIEEIARIYGYEKIPSIIPIPSERDILSKGKEISEYNREKKVREICTFLGLDEIITYSLTSIEDVKKTLSSSHNIIKIKNPLSCQQEILRPGMLDSVLKVINHNINYGTDNLNLFELGKVYYFVKSKIIEEDRLIVALAKKTEFDSDKGKLFFKLKGIIQKLLMSLGLENFYISPLNSSKIFYPGICAELFIDKIKIGTMGYIIEDVLNNFNIDNIVAICDIELKTIKNKMQPDNFKYSPLVKYPFSYRDISMVVDEKLYFSEIRDTIFKNSNFTVIKVDFIEEYKGKQIPEGKKSLSCRITFQAKNRTLTDYEVEKTYKSIISSLKKQLKVQIR